mmetsp:Transcript_72170/g.169820  ORF Transcript_72170/g.169820 Transcript_72170/m.169820 type:complete len:231 (-) Transcript_72170:67-759(-)
MFSKLQLLSLSRNQIKRLENVQHLRIRALDITYNLIEEVSAADLPPTLLYLNIAHNPVELESKPEVMAEIFDVHPELRCIDDTARPLPEEEGEEDDEEEDGEAEEGQEDDLTAVATVPSLRSTVDQVNSAMASLKHQLEGTRLAAVQRVHAQQQEAASRAQELRQSMETMPTQSTDVRAMFADLMQQRQKDLDHLRASLQSLSERVAVKEDAAPSAEDDDGGVGAAAAME